MSTRIAAIVACLACAAIGCSKDDKGKGAASSGGGNDDATVAAWKKAGLEVSALTDVDAKPYSAQKCSGGTVSGVDVVLCKYDTGEDAKAAEEPGLDQIGNATGASLAKGARLLVVADRRKADPSGRTIDTITKTFRK